MENDGIYFYAQYFGYVRQIHDELASLHIDDPQLDDLIEEQERDYYERNHTKVEDVTKFPEGFHLSIDQIEEIGERLKFLAAQIRTLK
jgi:hypothetical protein